MSARAEELAKRQVQNWFKRHPRSRETSNDTRGKLFPAIFNNPTASNNRDAGRQTQKKNAPHLTCFVDDVAGFEKGDVITFDSKTFYVWFVNRDKTDSTYKAEIILTVKKS